MEKSRENKVINTNHNLSTRNKLSISSKTATAGITLIALIVTIIVLLVLARSNNCDFNRRKWNINTGR